MKNLVVTHTDDYDISQHLGEDPKIIEEVLSGKHPFAQKLLHAKKPLIILGSQQLERCDGIAILSKAQQMAKHLSTKVRLLSKILL